MNGLQAHGEYCARQAATNRAAANQLEHHTTAQLVDPTVVADELAHADRLRRDADLWDQLAAEINAYLAVADQEEPQLWP